MRKCRRYLFHNVFGPVISGLFAGNAVVVKVSEHVAWSAKYFKDILDTCLTANGHSKDLGESNRLLSVGFLISLRILTKPLPTTSSAICHRSPQVGRMNWAEKVRRCRQTQISRQSVTETKYLFHQDFAILRHDVEFDRVLHILMRGTFQNAGQNCIGLERLLRGAQRFCSIIAHETVYDKLTAALYERIKRLQVGAPLEDDNVDVGALTLGSEQMSVLVDSLRLVDTCPQPNSFQCASLRALIEDAVSSGARLLHGGGAYVNPRYPSGQYFSPTLLVDVTPKMKIANEECFAPVLILMKYGKKGNGEAQDDEEAVGIANRCEYRLGGSVFGRDVAAAQRLAERCKCGMMKWVGYQFPFFYFLGVCRRIITGEFDPPFNPSSISVFRSPSSIHSINDYATSYLCNLPFGGLGQSGYGRFNGAEGLRGNCFAIAVTADRFDAVGVRTSIPSPVRLPISDTRVAAAFLAGMIRTTFSRDLKGKVQGLREMAGWPAKPPANKEKAAEGGGSKEE
ncbi:MAG: LOW QUALITY PROTEIN: aldehyde dehydrogenase family-domain-containing protein [Olpidium bornovanus]|uniref:Aldehyde dehydrogenase family-domain-containing protein n=1 Tax=Olpidium bornovanus TaxID=278681 RepID=A0A8H8DLQ1_9FUNG|nr:MAG: LOW QUALITY PROTEIN: aldehyde dehydrogenase family-domain-containing protein [Olpidium bornovanus]